MLEFCANTRAHVVALVACSSGSRAFDLSVRSAMSLPTPPGTSHKGHSQRRASSVLFSPQLAQFRPLAVNVTVPAPSKTRAGPQRSILKQSHVLATIPEESREPTPEPEDPLASTSYLDSPVANILSAETDSLRELVEAYSILNARIRASLLGSPEADGTWPLFHPIRANQEAFVRAITRDLGRALVDPLEAIAEDFIVEDEPMPCSGSGSLPSPRESPKKRKKGMSAEQVKHARDLCTATHAVLRLLALVFTIPAVYSLFTSACFFLS